jgi:hypothetical protein
MVKELFQRATGDATNVAGIAILCHSGEKIQKSALWQGICIKKVKVEVKVETQPAPTGHPPQAIKTKSG